MNTGLVFDERFKNHRTAPGHPERPERIDAIGQQLTADGLLSRCSLVTPVPAGEEAVLLTHSSTYVERLRSACRAGKSFIDSADSTICPESMDIALLNVGGILEAVDQVMAGKLRNAFCAGRPPGHHAEHDRSMGFCLFANAAIAARHLTENHKLSRVFIVDWDVHHGNGTQHILEEDPRVLFCSIHTDPTRYYPGTGFAHETGIGAGKGFTLNVPMPPGSNDAAYRAAFEETILPRARTFAPEFVLISAGFDAHKDDPLGNQLLETSSYRWMTEAMMKLADEHCGGRLVSMLEGGYNLRALASSVAAHVDTLSSR